MQQVKLKDFEFTFDWLLDENEVHLNINLQENSLSENKSNQNLNEIYIREPEPTTPVLNSLKKYTGKSTLENINDEPIESDEDSKKSQEDNIIDEIDNINAVKIKSSRQIIEELSKENNISGSFSEHDTSRLDEDEDNDDTLRIEDDDVNNEDEIKRIIYCK